MAVSIPPLFAESTPERVHPLRAMDILGIPDFFDHAGNCVNGNLASYAIIGGSILLQRYIPESKSELAVAGTATAAAAGSIGVNVAYEAGVYIPPFDKKPENAPFDAQDALYGGAAGALLAIVYGIAAIRQVRASKAKRRP